MDERIIEFRVGVVVIAAAIITAILIMFFGAAGSLAGSRYTIYIRFPQAPGVSVDTPVRKSGVLIGRVKHIELFEGGGVILTLHIDKKYPLRRSEICRIGRGSLLGDAVLEFVPGRRTEADEMIKDGDYLTNGLVAADPVEVLGEMSRGVPDAIRSVSAAGEEITVLARNLNAIVGNNADQVQRIMARAEEAVDRFRLAMVSFNELVGDPELRERLKTSLEQFPGLVVDARSTLTQARDTLAGFDTVTQRAQTNLEHLEKFTQPLGERGGDIVSSVDQSVQSLDELLGQLVQFGRSLNTSQGTVGRLVKDPELYERLNRAAAGLEDLSVKLAPILGDVRVFTDKIARDPRQLGVKGALDRRPSGAGFKVVH